MKTYKMTEWGAEEYYNDLDIVAKEYYEEIDKIIEEWENKGEQPLDDS